MKRGLLIDDDETYLHTLRRALERRDYEVSTAGCAEEALRQVECFHPDFALLDLKLGQESGLNLIAPLKEAQPSLVIILVTGYASVATAVEAMKKGADNYLMKPVSIPMILKTLGDEVLDGSIAGDPTMTPLRRVEWEHIQQAMVDADGNISAAARLLGMHRRSLQRKLAKRPSPKKIIPAE
jgi:two-component system response regulator RegA